MKFGSGIALVLAASGGLAVLIGSSTVPEAKVWAKDDASKPAYFTEKVKPILEANCTRCHGGANHRGTYSMNTHESLYKGGHHGGAVVPGHPESSMLIKLVRHEGPADDPMPMPPPPKAKISDADIAVLEAWVKAGAVTPDGPIFVAPPAPPPAQ